MRECWERGLVFVEGKTVGSVNLFLKSVLDGGYGKLEWKDVCGQRIGLNCGEWVVFCDRVVGTSGRGSAWWVSTPVGVEVGLMWGFSALSVSVFFFRYRRREGKWWDLCKGFYGGREVCKVTRYDCALGDYLVGVERVGQRESVVDRSKLEFLLEGWVGTAE